MSPEKQNTADDLLARVVDLAGLIDYQTGAVVSRTLIVKPTGTVTLFAFDAGQELSEHTSPFDALVQVLEGETEISISGEPMRVAGGQMLIMPAGKPHAVRAVAQCRMLLVMIRDRQA
jgi:quercetin dioxygenase-like cupin family protein